MSRRRDKKRQVRILEQTQTPGTNERTEALREVVEALETQIREADGRHIAEVTLIRSGTSKNGNQYSSDCLRESVPLFEGARAFADHAGPHDRAERSVRDLVGYYRNVREDSGRLRGELHILPGQDWLFHLMRESQTYPDLCGLSIDANGDITPDRKAGTRIVNRIHRVNSVDVVTRPSAGGSFDRILQSHSPGEGGEPIGPATTDRLSAKEQAMDPDKTPVATKENTDPKAPTPATQKNAGPDLATLVEQQNLELQRARDELARVQSILAPTRESTPSGGDERVSQLVEEIKRERDLTRCDATLRMKLAESRLPEPVQAKLSKRYSGRVFEAGALDSDIAEERDMLAALTSLGQVHGLGYEKGLTVGASEYDQVQAAFDALFDIHESEGARSVPRLSGIREAFRVATGFDIGTIGGADRRLRPELLEAIQSKVRSGQLTESEAILREADVTNSSFSYLLGTSMNKKRPTL